VSNEEEIKKILNYKQSLENRIVELKLEIQDLSKALELLDKQIVSQGFKTPVPPSISEPSKIESEIKPPEKETEESISITAKNGTVLGRMYIEGKDLSFKPIPDFKFTSELPPFKSFLIDRVLSNMKTTDEQKSKDGELDPSEILSYEIIAEEKEIKEILVKNYGGERRLREINSSLRWTFDKMFEKIYEG
jgi:hypothetical protein